jgi:adenylate cyclase
VPDIRLITCWLLVADLQGFTTMSQRLNPEELAPLVGKWMAACQGIVSSKNGVLAKFLGDGFLAYWTNREDAVTSIVSACREFQELQKGSLPFRIMLHQGLVSFGGHSPDASHTMMGQELNFAFRLEKVASRLNLSWIFSDVAESQLKGSLPLASCGPQKIPDFEPERVCFTLAG